MTSPARICFQLQVKPELLDEYLERHSPVWPEMLAEIAASGRRNYSLYLADGGRLIGYYETDDDAAAQAYLAHPPSPPAGRPRWGGSSSASTGRPDQAATPLTEIFHLEDQLGAAAASPTDNPLDNESDAS